VMGESDVSNSLTYVNVEEKKAEVVEFEREKVEGRCFHGQCLYGEFLLVSVFNVRLRGELIANISC
jgi:hypothetical protein